MKNPFKRLETKIESEFQEIRGLLANNNSKDDLPEEERVLSIDEAADFLKLSKNTIYAYVQKQTVPVSKKGNRLFFLKSELLDWIKEGKRKTVGELSQEADNFLTNTKKA